MIEQRAMDICDAAVRGTRPSRDDVRYLLAFDAHSPEAAYLNVRAWQIGYKSAGGQGRIEAQIGVDAHRCPVNCAFCSFAACNDTSAIDTSTLDTSANDAPATAATITNDAPCSAPRAASSAHEPAQLAVEDVVRLARIFDEAGVSLISLMGTAGLPFDDYLALVRGVRAAVADDMPLMANYRDVTLDEARQLKEAGIDIAYHALRLGEGVLSAIDPSVRRHTIENLRQAGIALASGIEPLWQGAPLDELVERMFEMVTFLPFSTGVCALTVAPHTKMAHAMSVPRARVQQVAAVLKLIVGDDVPFGCVGGSIWVDAGTDPRARGYGHGRDYLLAQVNRARRDLEQNEWQVAARPNRARYTQWAQEKGKGSGTNLRSNNL